MNLNKFVYILLS